MLLSVIIPTCNRNDLLSQCLDLLSPEKQSIDYNSYEVIITDDSKTNIAKELIEEEYKWAKWVSGPKIGPAANRNNGAKKAKGEWLIFIDDDCLPDKNILTEYQNAIKINLDCLAFEGEIIPDDWELMKKDLAECPINVSGGCFWSANICINHNLFSQVKGFDVDFLIAAQEDQFLYFRLRQRTQIRFLKGATVTHPVRIAKLSFKINGNIKLIKNWFIYTQKMNIPFGTALKEGYIFHIKSIIENIKSAKIKSSLINLHTIFLGLPLLFISYVSKKTIQKI